MKELIIICGSTCSGKSSLAVNVAEKLNTSVLSADSMCIYKGFNIGTAKPSEQDMKRVKHYMIDVADPFKPYSVADYKNTAEKIVDDILSQNKNPVICGGTGFYINSLIYDMSYGNGGENAEIREKLKEKLQLVGAEKLWNELYETDKASAEKIEKNDSKRVIRALEIFYSTGKKKSDMRDTLTPKRPYKAFCIDYPREELYERINARVDQMLECGLIDEVQGLINKGFTLQNNAMQGIGYKEIYSYLKGEMDYETAVETLKQNTRRYAKRQITFFKRTEGLIHLKPSVGEEKMAKIVLNSLEK